MSIETIPQYHITIINASEQREKEIRSPPTKLIQVQPQMTKRVGKNESGIDPQDVHHPPDQTGPPPVTQSMTHIIYTPVYMNQEGTMRRGREKKSEKVEIMDARKETKKRLLIIHFLGCPRNTRGVLSLVLVIITVIPFLTPPAQRLIVFTTLLHP